MNCRVYVLRLRGRRLPWREVINGAPIEGELSTHFLTLPESRYLVAGLVARGDALRRPLLPYLFEPVLVQIGHEVLVLRGFERLGDGRSAPAALQEWRCELGGGGRFAPRA
jgi:hypothetical protein